MKSAIYTGDNRIILKNIETDSIPLIVTSPPYFNVKDYSNLEGDLGKCDNYELWIETLVPLWEECDRILMPNGKMCIVTPIMPMDKEQMHTHYNRDILNINNDLERSILDNTKLHRYGLHIWDKISTDQLVFGSYPYPPNIYPLNNIEFINIFVKDGLPRKMPKDIKQKSKLSKERWREIIETIWKIPAVKSKYVGHPAPYPVEIPKRCIEMYSFYGDTVVDPFFGSGSTGIAAIALGREYIGIELNPDYVELSKRKIKEYLKTQQK